MIFLTKKKQKEIIDLIAANQIIMNAYDGLNGVDKFSAFGQFCDNSSEAIFKIGGMKSLNEVKQFIFFSSK